MDFQIRQLRLCFESVPAPLPLVLAMTRGPGLGSAPLCKRRSRVLFLLSQLTCFLCDPQTNARISVAISPRVSPHVQQGQAVGQ